MQTLANIEASHLGIGHDLVVSAENLGKYMNACYVPKDHKILVNEKILEYGPAGRVLSSVAHESYHAY